MNQKAKRTLDAVACVVYNQDAELIQNLHNTIADNRDGYPEYDFIAAVNSFRSLFGVYPSINYPKQERE